MSEKNSKSRGDKNDTKHIAERRRVVVKIFADQREQGIPAYKNLILEQLARWGYKTSQRTLERDIAFIFANNPSAILGGFRSMREINPGKKYLKMIKDVSDTESFMRKRSLLSKAFGSGTVLKSANEKIIATRKELGSISDLTTEYPE